MVTGHYLAGPKIDPQTTLVPREENDNGGAQYERKNLLLLQTARLRKELQNKEKVPGTL